MKMLTYMGVHLNYTLPFIAVLALFARPFVDRSEVFKIAFLSGMALAYTTPWDNYIIHNGGWSFTPDRVLAFVGYVPVEEYMFFVIQTVIISLWTLLCVRWSVPCSRFNHDPITYRLIRWVPIFLLAAITAVGFVIAVPGHSTFYLGCVFWWICPVMMFLWYGTGNYFTKNLLPAAAAIVVPALFLCRIDQIALRHRVWIINGATSLQIDAAEDLPFEEAFFFFVSSLMVVLAVSTFDKSRAMTDAYALEFPQRFGFTWRFLRQLFWAFATPEHAMPSAVTQDIRRCTEALGAAEKSFTPLFPIGIRLDLTILFAFCRVTNDAIRNEPDAEKKKHKLQIIKSFVDELFDSRKSDYEVLKKPQQIKIDWIRYESELTDTEMSCFRAISRIAFYLPRKPFHELLAGYEWDAYGRLVRSEDDLLSYSNLTTGSICALSVYVMMYKCDDVTKYGCVEKYDHVIEKAQKMGRVIRLVDIARNIVSDSESFGRCYVPTEYMDDGEEEVRILCGEKNPRSLGDKKLKKYSTRMIQLSNKYLQESANVVKYLPHETRGPVLAVVGIYREISSTLQSSQTYPTGALVSKCHQTLIGLYALYIKRISYCF